MWHEQIFRQFYLLVLYTAEQIAQRFEIQSENVTLLCVKYYARDLKDNLSINMQHLSPNPEKHSFMDRATIVNNCREVLCEFNHIYPY